MAPINPAVIIMLSWPSERTHALSIILTAPRTLAGVDNPNPGFPCPIAADLGPRWRSERVGSAGRRAASMTELPGRRLRGAVMVLHETRP
jgi:hypothetical protein